MTLFEALQTGRPVYREEWFGYWSGDVCKNMDTYEPFVITSADLIATDWEVKEQ